MRISQQYIANDVSLFKKKLLQFASAFKHVTLLESNPEQQLQPQLYGAYDALYAIDSLQVFTSSEKNALGGFQEFLNQTNDWCFGSISYDTKNILENLSTSKKQNHQHDYISFFIPRYLIIQHGNSFELHMHEMELDFFKTITSIELGNFELPQLSLQPSLTLEKYQEQFELIQQHIQYGNIYEMNFCFDFSTQVHDLNCMDVWQKLNAITNAPMSAYFTFGDVSVLCSSPERYIKREQTKLIAQPIKGTAKRSRDLVEDNLIKQQLKENLKEQNENVMIVDLMRNDLSRVATRASVNVEELFGVYSFEQVHQLISTVTCDVASNTIFTDIIKATFPMGSMTGAPKIEAMKIIDAVEPMSRGLYAGCIGYIAPNGNFDLNVVIRSLIYSHESGYLSYCAGSAITAMAKANEEYIECMLKANVINQLFSKV